VITTFGVDFVTANCKFLKLDTNRQVGKASLVRTPEGWRVASAHVSWFTTSGLRQSMRRSAFRWAEASGIHVR
jgi:hypothetical protein